MALFRPSLEEANRAVVPVNGPFIVQQGDDQHFCYLYSDGELTRLHRWPGMRFNFLWGRLHSVNDEPSLVWPDGHCQWHKNGLNHRDNDKPANVEPDFHVWYVHGKQHREDCKPAYIFTGAGQTHYRTARHDKFHNVFGPAIWYDPHWEGNTNTREYYLWGKKYDKWEWRKRVELMKKYVWKFQNRKARRFVALCRSEAFNRVFYAEGGLGRKWDEKKLMALEHLSKRRRVE